ncbi:hypothetical protein M0R45_000474 [Rubus argutus]|uniref:Uncharacterized protein n=1 Tax=Rubus argutus TaxID=59490 RepID=A0AAW1VLR5_RUBAR
MEDCVVIRWKIRRDVKAFMQQKPSMNDEYNNNSWAVCGGVLTIVLGLFFLAVGFPIIADLCMKLFRQFRNPDESGKHQGGKMKTICIICRIIVSVIAMLMLAWAIYTGLGF